MEVSNFLPDDPVEFLVTIINLIIYIYYIMIKFFLNRQNIYMIKVLILLIDLLYSLILTFSYNLNIFL